MQPNMRQPVFFRNECDLVAKLGISKEVFMYVSLSLAREDVCSMNVSLLKFGLFLSSHFPDIWAMTVNQLIN